MAVTLEELQIKFTASTAGLQTQLNGVKQQINGIGTASGTTSKALGNMARYAKVFVGAILIKGMLNVGKASIAMANEVVESEQLFEVSMKGMAGTARDWSENLSRSLGLNAYSARRNVGIYNTMFNSMGLGTAKSYELSTGLVELAEDMASFYNLSSEETFDKLRSGITGMGIPLKQLGIIVDDNMMKQYAMSEGISKTGKDMTEAQKVMARYAAIIAQTSDAQGDLARTLDSPTNQIRLLNNTLDMAKIALGQAFQPILEVALPALNALVAGIKPVIQALGYFIQMMSGLSGINVFAAQKAEISANKQGELSDSIDATSKSLKGGGKAAKQAAKDTKVGLKAFDEINKIADEATKAGGGGKLDSIEVPDLAPAEGYADLIQVISNKVKAMAEALKDFWEGIKNSSLGTAVSAGWNALKNLWENVVKPFGEWALQNPSVIGDVIVGIGAAVATWKIGLFLTGGSAATGLGKAIASIGAAIAAHPVLFGLAVVAGGLALLAGSINSANKAAVKEFNDNAFGKLTISLESLRNMARTVKTPFTDAMQNLKKDFEALSEAGDRLRGLADLNAQLIYGYNLVPEKLTKTKIDELILSVQKQVDDSKELLDQAQITASMGLEALLGGKNSEILSMNKESWEKIKAEMASLGAELQKAVTDAMLDGVISAEERKGIEQLQAKLSEMMLLATDPDIVIAKAEIKRMQLDFDKATLTPETVKNFNLALNERQKELNKLMDEQSRQIINYAVAIEMTANPDIADKELQKIIKQLEDAASIQKLDANFQIEKMRITGPMGEIKKAFKQYLDESEPAVKALGDDYMQQAIMMMFKSGKLKNINTKEGSQLLSVAVSSLVAEGLASAQPHMDKAAKDSLQQWIDMLSPDYVKWKEMEAEYKRLGLAIPKEITAGISDYKAMIALGGSMEQIAQYVELSGNFDTTTWSQSGLNAILELSGALSRGEIDIQTAIRKINKLMEAEIGKADLQANIKFTIEGLVKGITNAPQVKQVKDAVTSVADNLGSWFKGALGIKSPSTVFAGFGENIIAGLANGIRNDGVALSAIQGLVDTANDAMGGINMNALNGDYKLNAHGNMNVEATTDFAGAIESGIERGVERVMNALHVTLNMDGEQVGRMNIKTINNAQRMAGRVLLEF